MTTATAPSRRVEQLRWVAAACALAGLGALVTHAFGLMPMPFFLMFFGVPSVLFLFALAAYARRIDAGVFLNALKIGVLGGLAGTLVYDGVRAILHNAAIFDYDGFTAIYIFGGWITSTQPTTAAAAFAGWTYHFWNGISFGIFYCLTFGRRHWLFGVGYGLVMEACMLGLFPLFLHVTNRVDFIALSLIGHVFYGGVLGAAAQRFGRSWSDAFTPKSGMP